MSDTGWFLMVGGFESPTAAYGYLMERGCEPSDIKLHLGPDRRWRGIGRVTHLEHSADGG